MIQNYCHQTISKVTDDQCVFDVPAGRDKLFLPELPVVTVSSVSEAGVTLTADSDYKLGNGGVLYRASGTWRAGVQTVKVVYSHGYETIPDDIKYICTRAAARSYQAGLNAAAMAGVSGVQAQSIGDYSVQYGSQTSGSDGMLGATAAPMLLPSERRILARYRYRGA